MVQCVILTIRDNAHRLARLDVAVATRSAINKLFPSPCTAAPLRALSIETSMTLFRGINEAQKLHILEAGFQGPIKELSIDLTPGWDFSRVPVHSLEAISVNGVARRSDLETLFDGKRTSLKTARVTCYPPRSDSLSPLEFYIPTMKTFFITDTTPLTFPRMFLCPNLETLALDCEDFRWSSSDAQRSMLVWTKLTSLTLANARLASEPLVALFSMNPTILHLTAERCGDLPTLLHLLTNISKEDSNTSVGDKETLLPHLNKLVIIHPMPQSFQVLAFNVFEGALLQLMRKRSSLIVDYHPLPLVRAPPEATNAIMKFRNRFTVEPWTTGLMGH